MQARAMFSRTNSVLPVRLDKTEVPGLMPNVGYLVFHDEGIDGIIEGVSAKFRKDNR
jgi:hypothetical protein